MLAKEDELRGLAKYGTKTKTNLHLNITCITCASHTDGIVNASPRKEDWQKTRDIKCQLGYYTYQLVLWTFCRMELQGWVCYHNIGLPSPAHLVATQFGDRGTA